MRKLLIIAIVATLAACSGGDLIRSRAELYVRNEYNDVGRIIYYSVDTITFRDNLAYRIAQSKLNIGFAERLYDLTASTNAEMKQLGGTPDLEREREHLGNVERERARAAALDSLMKATPAEVLDAPAAYQCCIAYNTSSNLVWLQLSPTGDPLLITKEREKLFINPGGDIPEYYEINDRFKK